MILEGKTLAVEIKEELRRTIIEKKLQLKFVIIQVGNDAASDLYIRNKIKYAADLNIAAEHMRYPEEVTQKELEEKINELNLDTSVHGIILQLPIAKHLDEYCLLQCISPDKDIDGLTEINMGRIYFDQKALVSATAAGVVKMLDHYQIAIESQNITIAGSSNLVGKVLALMLINRGATLTVCNSKTKDIKKYIDTADIFITAIGVGNYFDHTYFTNKKDLVVIDVGTNFVDGKLVGDVNFKKVEPLVKDITPVPGGVGVLTVAELINNLVNTQFLK